MVFCLLSNGMLSNVPGRAEGRKGSILTGARKRMISYDFILKNGI